MTSTSWHDEATGAPVWPGRPDPLGATWSPAATNFAVFAPEADAVEVCLFDDSGEPSSERRLRLTEHTLGIWHGAVPALPVGQLYGFRVHGPWDPGSGRRFNPAKLLLDPYARAVAGDVRSDAASYGHRRDAPLLRSDLDSAAHVPRSVVVDDH
ncbi:MAG TPA: glycogen debranching enzyme GlgX, partial [Nocardioidaceae bacterium]|nr:glycogen debranching enzyme GlgX [Nocardioidaceae bacterium]